MLAQKAAIGFDTGPQQFSGFRKLALHFRQQGVADLGIERGRIGMAGGGARHGDATAGAFMQAERVGGAGDCARRLSRRTQCQTSRL
jgi:hypothetical protein